jgi:hypothetical protein
MPVIACLFFVAGVVYVGDASVSVSSLIDLMELKYCAIAVNQRVLIIFVCRRY